MKHLVTILLFYIKELVLFIMDMKTIPDRYKYSLLLHLQPNQLDKVKLYLKKMRVDWDKLIDTTESISSMTKHSAKIGEYSTRKTASEAK